MMEIVFVADFFVEHILGGGELNNEEFVKIVSQAGHKVTKLRSFDLTPRHVRGVSGKFVIANFMGLSEETKTALEDRAGYVIYEHDHKYLSTRNPADFDDFVAPDEHIVNRSFYENAMAVFCQSAFHKQIVQKNLPFKNIHNLGGNLWDVESLAKMRELSNCEKREACSIMDSPIEHKNTADALKYCFAKKIPYDLIKDSNYYSFLAQLGANKKFVFLPKTPETLSRVVVEARMMGMQVITNKLVGATHEPWFKHKGIDLIEIMEQKRSEIPQKVLRVFE